MKVKYLAVNWRKIGAVFSITSTLAAVYTFNFTYFTRFIHKPLKTL